MTNRTKLSMALLIAAYCWGQVGTASAQFKLLHSFNGAGFDTDGVNPSALVVDGETLYGTTSGDLGGAGVFSIKTDGSDFRKLQTLSSWLDYPVDIALVGSRLYAVNHSGGINNQGSILHSRTDGVGFGPLHSFRDDEKNRDGANPNSVIESYDDSILYGATTSGGTHGGGTIFSMQPVPPVDDGEWRREFKVLHNFDEETDGHAPTILAVSESEIFGTTGDKLFSIQTDNNAFNVLDIFDKPDGAMDDLVLGDSKLYTATSRNRISRANRGTIFSINTDGTGYSRLLKFPNTSIVGSPINLVLHGSTLYGTAQGGVHDHGFLFSVESDGTGFTVLHDFDGENGSRPVELILDGSTLYGTTWLGGEIHQHNGTVFAYSIPEPSGFALLATGCGVLGFRQRKRTRDNVERRASRAARCEVTQSICVSKRNTEPR